MGGGGNAVQQFQYAQNGQNFNAEVPGGQGGLSYNSNGRAAAFYGQTVNLTSANGVSVETFSNFFNHSPGAAGVQVETLVFKGTWFQQLTLKREDTKAAALTAGIGELRVESGQTLNLDFRGTGARLSYAATPCISPYIGAACEYEFDGKAQASTAGYDIDAPHLKGSTGIGELGVTYKPAVDRGFCADLGVRGYVGKREGAAGGLRVWWKF